MRISASLFLGVDRMISRIDGGGVPDATVTAPWLAPVVVVTFWRATEVAVEINATAGPSGRLRLLISAAVCSGVLERARFELFCEQGTCFVNR